MSACRASAGPLTTQPMTATVIGTLSFAMYDSTALTVGTMSYSSRPHVGRLQRDLDVTRTIVEVFEDLAVTERHLDHSLRGAFAVVAVDVMLLAQALVNLLRQRTRIDTDAKRNLALLGRGHDLHDLLAVWDVAWIQTQAVDASLNRQQRQRVVVVDVRNHWERRSLDDLFERLRRLVVRHGRPHELASGRHRARGTAAGW